MKIEAAVAALTVMAVEMFALVVAVATADSNCNGGQNRVPMKVSCNKEGGGNGSKSDGNKGGRQATAMATTWAMATETRLVGDEEGKCKGSKGNGEGNEGRGWWRQWLKQGQWWHRRQQWQWRWQTTTEIVGAGNNQQNAAGGSGSGRDNSHGSGNRCSAAAMGRQGRRRGGSDNNESSSNSNKYPLLPLAMVRDDAFSSRSCQGPRLVLEEEMPSLWFQL